MDVKLAGLLSELAYGETISNDIKWQALQQDGWVMEGPEDTGYGTGGVAGAFRIFRNINPDRKEIVIAFKGSSTVGEFIDDLTASGRAVISNVVARAQIAFGDPSSPGPTSLLGRFPDYRIYTTGHSLGGAAAQSFALLNGLDTYFFNSLPVSSTLLAQKAASEGKTSDEVIAAFLNSPNRVAIGTYYGGEIADFTYRALTGGRYLDPLMSEVPSQRNMLAAVALLVLTKALGPIGFLASFIGVKGEAHRMAVLNEAMARVGVNSETGELLVPHSNPVPLPTEQLPTVLPNGWIEFPDGYVAEGVDADGALVVRRRDEAGQVVESLLYNTLVDPSGGYSTHWTRISERPGEVTVTDRISTNADSTISFEQKASIQGLEVVIAEYEFDADGQLNPASLPDLAHYASVFQQAETAFAGQPEDLARFKVEFFAQAHEFGRAVGADIAQVEATMLAAIDGFSKSIANAGSELTAEGKVGGALFEWGQALATDVLRAFRDALDTLLTAASGTAHAMPPSIREALATSLSNIELAAQRVVVRSDTGANPFDDPTFDPNVSPVSIGGLEEGSFSTFTVYLPYEAGIGGQRIRLDLGGVAVEKLSVLGNGEEVELDTDGVFTLTVAQGQREISFSVAALADLDADETLTLSAQLVNATDQATHQPHDELTLTLDAENETAPAGGMEYHGDWGLKYYPAFNEDGSPMLDDNGEHVHYAKRDERYPHLDNLERDSSTSWDTPLRTYVIGGITYYGPPGTTSAPTMSHIHGHEELADRVWMADANGVDVAYTYGGADVIFGSGTAWQQVLAGAGDDWVEGGGNTANNVLDTRTYLGREVSLGDDEIHGGSGNDVLYGESAQTQHLLSDATQAATGLPGDWINGGTGNDKIYGTAGDDVLLGGTGEDLMQGGAGRDVLLGDENFGISHPGNLWRVMHTEFGDSTFTGFEVGLFPVYNYQALLGAGWDAMDPNVQDPYVTYYKGGGDDVLIGGGGTDILIGQFGNDQLHGGDDDDILAGWEGEDEILGGEGDDKIAGDFGRYEQPNQRQLPAQYVGIAGLIGSSAFNAGQVDQQSNDYLDGGAGNDTVFGEGGDDVVMGRDGTDVLYGDGNYLPDELHGADLVDGGAGNDALFGNGGNDRLFGGADNDVIDGGSGNDQAEGGAGNDNLAGGEGDDSLNGGEGEDALAGGAGIDTLYGSLGNDQLDGGEGGDTLYGEAGVDTLEGGAGADVLHGGSGEDILSGGEGNDRLDGGAGIDVARGGEGDDTYVLALGYGQDLIEDTQGTNRLAFGAGVTAEDLTATVDSTTLAATITFSGIGDSVSFNAAETSVTGVDFASGASWGSQEFIAFMPALVRQGSAAAETLSGIESLRNDLRGEGGDDVVSGSRNDDALAGGDGADVLDGMQGADRYVYAADETGIDRLSDSGTAGRQYLEWFYGSRGVADWEERGIHGGRFRAEGGGEGGSFVEYFDTYEEAFDQYPWATITFVEPLAEIAPVVTRNDEATLAQLVDAGVLDTDVVAFGEGLALGDLTLTVTVNGAVADAHPDQPWYEGGTLSVRWGAGGFDVEVPSVSFGFPGGNLFAGIDGYRLGEGVERFAFADGTTYSLEEILEQAEVVRVVDFMVERGSGFQTVDAGSYDGLFFAPGIAAAEVIVSRDGVDLLVSLSDASATVLLPGWFANPPAIPDLSLRFATDPAIDPLGVTRLALTQRGTEAFDFLEALDGFPNALHGLGGFDVLQGGTGADLLDGGTGQDSMQGGGGDDRYLFAVGYGEDSISEDRDDGGGGLDTLVFLGDVQPEDVSLSQDYGTLVVSLGNGDEARLFGWFTETNGTIERLEFGDGTVWDAAAIEAQLPPGGEGSLEDDVLLGGTGDDVLSGLAGNDELYGNGGDDVLDGGDGADYVEGSGGTDIVRGGAGEDDIEDWLGSNLLEGGEGDDYLYEEGGSFVIGGAGDDEIDHAGDGGVIAFNLGDGHDAIWVEGAMTLSLGAGVAPADLALAQAGGGLLLSIGQSDSIALITSNPAAWPRITLQMFGSVHLYDFNAVIGAFYEALDANPELAQFPLDGILQAHETSFSETEALGGDIAWQYATTGSTVGLTDEQIRAVLTDEAFGTDTQVIAVGNQAPTIDNAMADQSAAEDSAFTYTVPEDAFADADAGDTLTYTATLADGSALPAWLAFDAAARTFSGTPLQSDVGALDVRVTVTDASGLSISDEFVLAVAAVNDAPTLAGAIADQSATEDVAFSYTVSASTFADVDPGDALSYTATLADGMALPAWLTFDAATRTFSGTPLQANAGAIDVRVRATDSGGLHAQDTFTLNVAAVNDAPVVSVADARVLLGQAVAVATLFSVSDEEGGAPTQYQFKDSTAGHGYFTVGGIEQGVHVAISVSAADLADTAFVAAPEIATDLVWARAFDGQAWSDWKHWNIGSAPHLANAAPVVAAANATVEVNHSVAAGSLLSVTDGDADPILQYQLWDGTDGGGYWQVNGVQIAGQAIVVSAADFASAEYVGGASGGEELVGARASDGMDWSAWKIWEMNSALHVPNTPPVVSTSNQGVLLGQSLEAAALFSVSDADGDAMTRYQFKDGTAGNGHFTVNGVIKAANAAFEVAAADLAGVQFVGSAANGSDTVLVRANDGSSWSNWKGATVTSAPHLTNATPVLAAQAGGLLRNASAAASSLFSASDADADPILQYEFWDEVNGGGYWSVNGVQQASGRSIAVSAAELASTAYVGGANPGTEQVWARAHDGIAWGAWKKWLMSTEGGMLRGGIDPDTLTGDALTPILEGSGGDDTLNAGPGNNLLSGGSGNDAVNGGAGNDIVSGGAGDDMIETGAGSNVVVFNAGDGSDIVTSAAGASNTLSLGGGIDYDDVTFAKDGNDLVVNTGGDDQLVFKDWYSGKDNVDTLQIILDASAAFDASSSDPLYNRKVQTFDFRAMVSAFDQARAETPGMTSWAVTNALLAAHLAGSDDAALGGDLAYWYGRNAGFAGIGLQSALEVLGATGFGSDAQTLRPFNGLQEGFTKLS